MIKKIIVGFVLFLLVSSIGSYFGVSHILHRVVPPTSGQLHLPILGTNVSVYRDVNGIPHIEADNEMDLYRAFGYVHASERLFQLDLYRRASRGQLSEIFGKLGLEKDKLAKTLNFTSPLNHPSRVPLSDEAGKRIRAYLEGLNYFVKNGKLPFEFILLNYSPQAFELKDIYAFTGYMAFLFGNAPRQDPLFEKFRDYYDEETLDLMGNEVGRRKKALFSKTDFSLEPLYDQSLFHLPPVDGSNAWLVSKERSETGAPLFANDPHVGISLPGLWFEAHLKTPSFEVYGHYLPLIPFAALGHNRDKTWGMTISYTDDMDFYRETVNWEKKRLKYLGQEVPLQEKKHEILVKGGEKETLTSYIGPHGPLLGEASDKSFNRPEYALQWTYHHKDNRPLEAFYEMNYSQGIDGMRLAVGLGTAPGLNIMYADREGNIAWWMYGAIPIRPEGMQGDRVYPGESGSYDWKGHLTPDEKPQLENPPQGIIVSANGRPPGAGAHIKGYWQPQDRAQSIYTLLNQRAKWTVEGIKKLQNSTMNLKAKAFRDKLTDYLVPEVLKGSIEKKALYELVNWSGESDISSVGSTIYHLTTTNLLRNLFDELPGEDFLKYCRVNASWRALYRFSEKPEHSIWKNKTFKRNRGMGPIVQMSFLQAIDYLKKRFGDDVTTWTWGRLHQVEYNHPFATRDRPLKKLFQLGPFPAPGSYNSINNFRRMGCKYGFSVKAGPSTRVVVDLADTARSWGGLPLGNSGHFKSPYFSNERKAFLAGEHRPQLLDWKEIKNYSPLILSPSP